MAVRRVLFTTLTTLAACAGTPEVEMSHNPPPQPEVEVHGNPPPMPGWDDVQSGHPEGATNPPRPVLVVSSDGTMCWKEWEGGMMEGTPDTMDRVLAPGVNGKGTRIWCPDRAKDLLKAAQPVPTSNPPPLEELKPTLIETPPAGNPPAPEPPKVP